MKNEDSIEVLNTLTQINNDRIEGYKTASEETDEQDLKSFFSDLKQTSETCNRELAAEIVRLGGTPTESTKFSGKFFRVWMDVKAALNSKNREVILDSCEYGEDAAKDIYEEALDEDSDSLTPEQITMIQAQQTILRKDHDKVKSMRNALSDISEGVK